MAKCSEEKHSLECMNKFRKQIPAIKEKLIQAGIPISDMRWGNQHVSFLFDGGEIAVGPGPDIGLFSGVEEQLMHSLFINAKGFIVHSTSSVEVIAAVYKRILAAPGNSWSEKAANDFDSKILSKEEFSELYMSKAGTKATDEWDKIKYPTLDDEENELIRTARRNGFAVMFPATDDQDIRTFFAACKFLETLNVGVDENMRHKISKRMKQSAQVLQMPANTGSKRRK